MAKSSRSSTKENEYDLTTREIHSLWESGILSWMLWLQQLPIYMGIRELPPIVTLAVILCARQFGKTHLGVLMAIEDCLRHSNKSILVVGPTIKQCRSIVAPKVRDIARTAPPGLIRPSKSEGKWYIGDSDLIIGGFDQSRSSDRGKTLQNIYVEEVVDSNPDDYLESVRSDLGPALTHSDGGKMIYLTSLPKFPDHPFITQTMPEARLNGAFHSYTIDDNIMLSETQKERCIQLAGGVDSIDYRREYLNQVVRDASVVVLPVFDRDFHVAEIPEPDRAMWQISGDWGGVRDKTCLALHYYAWLTDEDVFEDELVFDANTPTHIIVAGLFEMERRWELDRNEGTHKRYLNQIVIDAHGQTRVDLMDAGVLSVYPDKKDWVGNVRHMASRFAEKKARINPRCKYLIENAASGIFNSTKTDFERTIALGHCDGLATMMYGLKTRGTRSPYDARGDGRSTAQLRANDSPNSNLVTISSALSGYRRK